MTTDPAAVAPRRSVKQSHFGPYRLLRTVGEGEFGKVKLAVDSRTNQEVAVKLLKRERVRQTSDRKKIMREITMLKALDHPYIVALIDVVETDAYIGLILQYAPGGELFHYIMSQPDGHLMEPEGRRFFAQLISGVSYMHSLGIVHRDLKLENLLLGPQNNILISDLGFANTHSEHMLTQCGSPSYAAPELVNSSDYVGVSVDIWSCGVILYGMLCGYLPYDDDPSNPDSENIQLLYQYIRTTVLTYPTWITPLAQQLMSIMLVPDPKTRAKMSDVMGHSWLGPEADIFQEELLRRLKKFGYSDSQEPDATAPESGSVVPADEGLLDISGMTTVRSEQSVPMQRNISVSSKFNFWGRKDTADNASVVPGSDARSSTTYSMDSRRSGGDQERKMHFHTGPVDNKALSTKVPDDLLIDLEIFFESKLKCTIQSTGSSTGEYKLRILKPSGIKIDFSTFNKEPAGAFKAETSGMRKSDVNDPKMNQIYSSFPVSLKSRITKFVTAFGSSSNRGFTGKGDDAATEGSPQEMTGMEEQILFTVEIQKVRDMMDTYVLEFRRVKGDKWAFKRLYNAVLGDLPL
ncbi:UNVERIFIED_CONTAM: hypothetical protein HDU68_004014 [Siphonaria sp. JEL0065]|nr:hypothetical protein HDU68_004014 [Siphonaria sp. JEL0065]